MPAKRWVGLLVTVFCITQALGASDVDSRGRDLIKQAEDKMDVFALPSFRMDANVRIDNFGKPLDGTYSLLWNGPNQWREEITFPGYSEIQIDRNGTLYIKRSSAVPPFRMLQLHSTLGFSTSGGSLFNQLPDARERIKKIRKTAIEGAHLTCVEVYGSNLEARWNREVCVDENTAILNRAKEGYFDSDLKPIGSKIFPRSLSLVRSGTHIVDVQITNFQAVAAVGGTLFEPPSGAVSRRGCMNPAPGRWARTVSPEYSKFPVEELEAHRDSMTVIYGLIDETGVPRNSQVVVGVGPTVDKPLLEAFKKSRYAPPTCDGAPVQSEGFMEIQHHVESGEYTVPGP